MKDDSITVSNREKPDEDEKLRTQSNEVIVDIDEPQEPLKDDRNYGIDILQILSMYGVVVNLLILQGEAGSAVKKFSAPYYEIKTIGVIVNNSADLFGLISGFLGHEDSKFSNIIYLWIQTFTISLIERIMAFYINRKKETLIRAFFPVFSNQYWYFTSYFGLFLLIPILNGGVNNLSQQSMKKLVASLIIFYSIIYTFSSRMYFSEDPFRLNSGRSVIWLTVLYLIGAYIGKYTSKEERTARGKIIFVIKWIVVYVVNLAIEILDRFRLLKINKTSFLYDFTSPTTLYQSIALIMLFSLIKVPNFAKKIVKTLSLLAYSTYIITFNKAYYLPHYIKSKYNWIPSKGSLSFVYLLSRAGLIYLICLVLDYARLKLFNALKIREVCIWLDNKVIHKLKFEKIFLV